jgi:hypothetical protein
MPTIYVRFRLHFGRQSLDHGDGIDRAVDVRNLCRAVVDGLCMLLKAGWGHGLTNHSPSLASPGRSRFTLSSGPGRWLLGEWRCVPQNETAAAVACGNDAISVEATARGG